MGRHECDCGEVYANVELLYACQAANHYQPQICNWHQEDDEYGTWEGDCGSSFNLNEGTPSDNQMKFCCYCGKKLVEHPFVEDVIDEHQ